MTPRQAAAMIRRDARALEYQVALGVEQSARDVFTTMIRNSSGTLTPAGRRRADYPYARRHGRPKLDPGFINAVTGRFRASWRLINRSGGREYRWRVHNIDPKASYLEQAQGSPRTRMFQRPVDVRTMNEARPRMDQRIVLVMRKADRS